MNSTVTCGFGLETAVVLRQLPLRLDLHEEVHEVVAQHAALLAILNGLLENPAERNQHPGGQAHFVK